MSFYGSDLKIETVNGIRYPDGFVVCSPVAPRATAVREPVVIFEVLSDSTARTDLVTKNQDTPRLKRCDAISCWRRNRWQAQCSSASNRTGLDTCCIPTACCECWRAAEEEGGGRAVALAELYEGVEFPDAEGQEV